MASGQGDMPAAEVELGEPLVRALLESQFPEWAGLSLRPLAFGWDNVLFRLGDAYVVRLPRRELAAALVINEQRWLPVLAPLLRLPVPVPLGAGEPGCGYPWHWSVCPWLPGSSAADAAPDDPAEAGESLAAFVAALHVPAPPDAPANPYRGVPLADRVAVTNERLEVLGLTRFAPLWEEAVAAPAWSGPPVWLHGDLHPANLLVHEGRLSAVVDFGDITSGDPASDLAVAWLAFDGLGRAAFRAALGSVDAETWTRARGWALSLAVAILANSADNPTMAAVATRCLDQLDESFFER